MAALLSAGYVVRAQNSGTAEAERYIKESERQWAESVANGDATVIERILADDFVGADPDGSFYNKAKMVADTRETPKYFVSNHLNEMKVRFYGDAAVAQGRANPGCAGRVRRRAGVSSGPIRGSAAMENGKSWRLKT
jgi:ketosteroid isomerase-like protein